MPRCTAISSAVPNGPSPGLSPLGMFSACIPPHHADNANTIAERRHFSPLFLSPPGGAKLRCFLLRCDDHRGGTKTRPRGPPAMPVVSPPPPITRRPHHPPAAHEFLRGALVSNGAGSDYQSGKIPADRRRRGSARMRFPPLGPRASRPLPPPHPPLLAGEGRVGAARRPPAQVAPLPPSLAGGKCDRFGVPPHGMFSCALP